jgi:ABC-type multidrug transport system ATPase subunit
MSLLKLENAGYTTASGLEIVKNLSFSLETGEALALNGRAGSGKTTALKLAAGLLSPTSGRILYKGQDLARNSRREEQAFRVESSFVFQDAALWANMSIYANLELPLTVHEPGLKHNEIDARIKEALDRAGFERPIDKVLRPAALSTGEQKLVAFARAIITRPRLLFLDEFTAGLDFAAAEGLVNFCRDFKEGGGTLLFVSHSQEQVEKLAERVIMIGE